MLHPVEIREMRWAGLMRQGDAGVRSARPNLFYPLFFRVENGRLHSVGEALPKDMKRADVIIPDGCFAVFPFHSNGEEARWGVSVEKCRELYEKGYLKFGTWKTGQKYRSVSYLQDGAIASVESGETETLGRDNDGTLILGECHKPITPMTTWNQQSHSAGDYGSSLLRKFFPGSRFAFPKSLYAVHDTLRFFVANKPNAIIVDFFAGSGTTLHAVNLLNAEDGGKRQCVMVTNNEVSDAEAKSLTEQGYKPGCPVL